MKKNLNPTYTPKDATFDFPVFLSLADKLGVLELVVWDKDVLKKDYLGEASLRLEDCFKGRGSFDFHEQSNTVRALLVSGAVLDTPPGLLDQLGVRPTIYACDRLYPSQSWVCYPSNRPPRYELRGHLQ